MIMNRKKLDPRLMYISASNYHKAARVLTSYLGQTHDGSIASPMIMNMAFSAEVYLKCIHVIRSGAPPNKIHFLKDLFTTLSKDDKTEIRKYFDELIKSNPNAEAAKKAFPGIDLSLEGQLTMANKAFTEWRYSYENPPSSAGVIGDLLFALRRHILNLQSDWKNDGPKIDIPSQNQGV
ncbi:MAG: hypothetical protein JWQ71_4767 [Pedosphaera sp.]|nr:hypothetical protein [Pedosphaera sp.]